MFYLVLFLITCAALGFIWMFILKENNMLFKSADKMFEDLGFEKRGETAGLACYFKNIGKCTQIIEVDLKMNGDVYIHSYEAGVNSDNFNNAIALTYKETKAAMKKARELKRKY